MDRMIERLRYQADQVEKDISRLVGESSGIRPARRSGSPFAVINPAARHLWNPLPPEGKALQARLIPKYDRFAALTRTLSRGLPEEAQRIVNLHLLIARDAVAQTGSASWDNTADVIKGVRDALDRILAALGDYAGAAGNDVLLLPDTNALLGRPDIEQWRLDGVNHFTLVLTPVVLSELDTHKVNHRNEDVRRKSAKIIRKLKEYRRRGSLLDGVSVVAGAITLRSVAAEPNADHSLPWLDFDCADDRFLASSLEMIRENLAAPVFVVTADINMQNKAAFAGIPCLDLDDLAPEEKK